MRKFVLFFALIVAFASPAFAVTVTEVAGSMNTVAKTVSIRVEFIEPSFEWDPVTGQPTTVPLTDLAGHYVYFFVNGGGVNQRAVAASAGGTGGALIADQFDGISIVGGNNTIDVYVTSYDNSGNESPASATVQVNIYLDNIPPSPPQ